MKTYMKIASRDISSGDGKEAYVGLDWGRVRMGF